MPPQTTTTPSTTTPSASSAQPSLTTPTVGAVEGKVPTRGTQVNQRLACSGL